MIALAPSPSHSLLTGMRPWKTAAYGNPAVSLGRIRTPIPYPEAGMTASLFEALRKLDLFSSLSDGDLLKLAALSRDRQIEKGEIIMRQDAAENEHLFILLQGSALAIWENSEGLESTLAALQSGDLIGELDLFDPSPSGWATVRATSPGRILSLRREDLLRGLRERPELALGFLCEMASRMRLMHRRVSGICHRKASRRLASALTALFEERGVRLKDSEGRRCLLLRGRPTQRVIAELAGLKRETASRLLAGWCREGWMQDRNGDLMIFEEARLRALAGE